VNYSELTQIRVAVATDGIGTRELAVFQRPDGTYWLQDCISDPGADSLWQIQDDSDTAIMDAIRDNGWELVD
jgi:hypothetical protein